MSLCALDLIVSTDTFKDPSVRSFPSLAWAPLEQIPGLMRCIAGVERQLHAHLVSDISYGCGHRHIRSKTEGDGDGLLGMHYHSYLPRNEHLGQESVSLGPWQLVLFQHVFT
jgi:hypothetical protein